MSRDRMKRADDRTDEGYMSCSRDARLLYSEMAHDCDDGGVMPASLIKLKALAFPGDSDLNAESMRRLMDELIQNRLVIEFEAEGRKFWHYLNWSEKQKVQRPTFRYPQPSPQQIRDAMGESTPGEFHEDSRRNPAGVAEQSSTPPSELKRNEEKGNELEIPPTPQRGKDSPKPRFDPSTVAIPANLDTPEFRAAWADWIAHRREIRKPLTERSCTRQLADLAQAGHTAASDAIRESIKNTWTGLFIGGKQNGRSAAPGPGQRFDPDRPIATTL